MTTGSAAHGVPWITGPGRMAAPKSTFPNDTPPNRRPPNGSSAHGTPANGTPAGPATRLDEVARAIAEVAAGRPVVVVDDADRENEGDIIIAASKMTPALMAFMIRHTSGVICVPLPGEDLDRLQLPLMTAQNTERMRTAFTISVDARNGVTTGISAKDRARTVRALVDSATEPNEAAVDLARLAGLAPAGALAEVVNDDGTMARLPALRAFADEHGLALISIAQLIEFRRHSEQMVRRVAETRLPNAHGEWRALGYQNSVDG